MSKILVTGATGFIGRSLSQRLCQDGHEVRCLVRKSSSATSELEKFGANLFHGEVNDLSALKTAADGCQVVYHSAGLRCALKTKDMYRVNADGCQTLAEACGNSDRPPRIILLSSLAAAGPVGGDDCRCEQQAEEPVSDYGKSKLAGEQRLAKFADRAAISIVRPGIVFGPRNTEMFPLFRSIWRIRRHFNPGRAKLIVSLIHVEDLIELLLRVAEQGECLPNLSDADPAERSTTHGRGIYFACDEECPSYQELGAMIGRALKREPIKQLHLPLAVVRTAAICSSAMQQLTRRAGVFNLDKLRDAHAPSWACTGAKAKADLDFEPKQSLQTRIDQTAAWYLENQWLK